VLGRRALRLRPGDAQAYGAVGDALIELGRYDRAFRAFDTMAGLKPGVPSYAPRRAARPAPRGDRSDAARACRGERTARAHRVGAHGAREAHLSLGDLADARGHARAALAAYPGYVYAYDVPARVEAAAGRTQLALRYANRAADTVPLPQFVTTLGDLYRAAGRTREASEQYAVIGAIERIPRSNGVRTALETALFDVDHGIRVREALARARRAHTERRSIHADDVLAWALSRNGSCAEALRYSKRALRLGTQDASSLFHRA
jgi:tetratricopeptide (TPR) repeat protein